MENTKRKEILIEMLLFLLKKQEISTRELLFRFTKSGDISKATLRRDLKLMEKKGVIEILKHPVDAGTYIRTTEAFRNKQGGEDH
jgi:DeoR/GlpR family transcriptional regulator of sugar metabolism